MHNMLQIRSVSEGSRVEPISLSRSLETSTEQAFGGHWHPPCWFYCGSSLLGSL